MLVLEIAFVLVNLAVPYWLWSSKTSSTLPAVERESVSRGVFRVIAASGGFPPCGLQETVDRVLDLCDKSRGKWTAQQSTVLERAGADVVFSCEVRKDEVRVRWEPNAAGAAHDLECGSRSDAQIAYAPTFAFNLKGQLRSITYARGNGATARVALTKCRSKLAAVNKGGRLPASLSPDDVVCMLFDPAEGWDPFRKKYD